MDSQLVISHNIIETMGQEIVLSYLGSTFSIKGRVHRYKKKEYTDPESPAGILVPYLKIYIKLTDLPERPEPGLQWVVRFENQDYNFIEVIDHHLTNMLICQLKEVREDSSGIMEHFNYGVF